MADAQQKESGVLPRDSEGHSVAEVVRELGASTKDLVQSEINLARAEIKDSAGKLGRHSAQAAVFGALLSLSVFPFLAFLVIGLGRIFDGRYWLSSLIVAVVCAAVGGIMTYRAYNKIKGEDLTLPRTRETLQRESTITTDKVHDIRDTTKRRAS